MRVLSCVAVLWVFACVTFLGICPAHADVFNELHGMRSLAMGGANRGLGGSNDALILNPAGMMMSRRYGVDVLYGWGGADERLNHLHLSAVDSKSGPVAGGLAYTRDWGNPSGTDASLNRIYLGSAVALGNSFALGMTGQTVRGTYTSEGVNNSHDAYNATVGMAANIGEFLGLGAVYQNIFPTAEEAILPPQLAFGASVRTGFMAFAADLVLDMRDNAGARRTWMVGGEYFVFNMVATRIGWRRAPGEPDQTGPDRNYLTGGLEIVTQGGAFGASGEKTLDGASDWRVLGGFQLFF